MPSHGNLPDAGPRHPSAGGEASPPAGFSSGPELGPRPSCASQAGHFSIPSGGFDPATGISGVAVVVAPLPSERGAQVVRFGVKVMDLRDREHVRVVHFSPDEWRQLVPRILQYCDVADAPGSAPRPGIRGEEKAPRP